VNRNLAVQTIARSYTDWAIPPKFLDVWFQFFPGSYSFHYAYYKVKLKCNCFEQVTGRDNVTITTNSSAAGGHHVTHICSRDSATRRNKQWDWQHNTSGGRTVRLQVQCAPIYMVDVFAPRGMRKEKIFPSMRANYFHVPRLLVCVNSMVSSPSHDKREFH
jgi:hypothetical protein